MKYSFLLFHFSQNNKLYCAVEELNIKNEHLTSMEKNRTSFFTNVSHDLKTPVNVIYSAEQLLSKQITSGNFDLEKIQSYIKIIKQNSFRLIRLINNLLDLTKIDDNAYKINLHNKDIIFVIESIVDSVADFIHSKQINVVFDTDIEEKIAAIDSDKVERIILNLLSNSVKFTNPGGSIFINIEEKDKYTVVHIKDTGIGMDEETQKKIFNRFFQSDAGLAKNQFGTGIGLSLVKSLMELHNGRIELISTEGLGSEFILYFPDVLLNEAVEPSSLKESAINGDKVERIQIEFSDIY